MDSHARAAKASAEIKSLAFMRRAKRTLTGTPQEDDHVTNERSHNALLRG